MGAVVEKRVSRRGRRRGSGGRPPRRVRVDGAPVSGRPPHHETVSVDDPCAVGRITASATSVFDDHHRWRAARSHDG
jgi:hypothetical protein